MRDPLATLLADGVIDEVVGRLKSGKEAEVWLVRHAGEILAAKVYKEREARNFRNNAAYTEGRRVRDTRTQRAMARGSRFGRAADEGAWKAREADALHTLYAGGVRVPRPHMFYEGVLLMELVVDANGHPAPRLIDAPVPPAAAAALFRDLRRQIVAMLCCDLVHADLSAYNVLLGREGPVLIDFPQVVGAAHNNQAERFLRRDVENLRHFFAQYDPALRAATGDAHEIWRAYVRRELTPDFVPPERGLAAVPVRMAPPVGHARGRGAPNRGARHGRGAAGAGGSPHPQARKSEHPSAPSGRHPGRSRPDQRQPEVVRVNRGMGGGSGPHARSHPSAAPPHAAPPHAAPPHAAPPHAAPPHAAPPHAAPPHAAPHSGSAQPPGQGRRRRRRRRGRGTR